MFGFFKKKPKAIEPHYDPTYIKITDLRLGWFLDYNYKTWEVAEEYEYDWGNNNFSYEFMLQNGDSEQLFLSLEEGEGTRCVLYTKLRFNKLSFASEVSKSIVSSARPPRQLQYEGVTYYRESENPGFFRNIKDEHFQEFIVWEYWDDSETKALNIEQWGDETFEASLGVLVKETDFSAITPAAK